MQLTLEQSTAVGRTTEDYLEEVAVLARKIGERLDQGAYPGKKVEKLQEYSEGAEKYSWGIRPEYDGDYLPEETQEHIESVSEALENLEPKFVIKRHLSNVEESVEEELDA